MKQDDIIVILAGDTVPNVSAAELGLSSRVMRVAAPEILDKIVVSVDLHMSVGESCAKALLFLDREMRHPKEQMHPRSPKARFRKGRY